MLSLGQLRDLSFRYRQGINVYSYRLAKRVTLPQNRQVIASKLGFRNDNPDWEDGVLGFPITQGEIQDSKLMSGHKGFVRSYSSSQYVRNLCLAFGSTLDKTMEK